MMQSEEVGPEVTMKNYIIHVQIDYKLAVYAFIYIYDTSSTQNIAYLK